MSFLKHIQDLQNKLDELNLKEGDFLEISNTLMQLYELYQAKNRDGEISILLPRCSCGHVMSLHHITDSACNYINLLLENFPLLKATVNNEIPEELPMCFFRENHSYTLDINTTSGVFYELLELYNDSFHYSVQENLCLLHLIYIHTQLNITLDCKHYKIRKCIRFCTITPKFNHYLEWLRNLDNLFCSPDECTFAVTGLPCCLTCQYISTVYNVFPVIEDLVTGYPLKFRRGENLSPEKVDVYEKWLSRIIDEHEYDIEQDILHYQWLLFCQDYNKHVTTIEREKILLHSIRFRPYLDGPRNA